MNRLAAETSPYLRQHRDNPVDWYPWGDEAFQVARRRDVPILLSVGYSACHWCHVMAHESFEDQHVADSMNAKFVCVKVDREERPDVDAVYMDAVQAMTGRGGWPMTVLIDPDGRPLWGGTYFPKENFLKLLDALDDVWRNRREDFEKNAVALVAAIGKSAETAPKDDVPGLDLVNRALASIAGAFDAEWGGFGIGPQVPFHPSPRTRPASLLDDRRFRRRARRQDVARRDGVGRPVRPHRRWVRPLLDRSPMAGAAFREDALRPGVAGAGLPPGVLGVRAPPLPTGGRGNDRLRAA